ncbi:hypothetical protein ACFYZ9_08075 [Streptomyces sp. NPDC001691]|uniref:hypothetical protein n=1 Tax=Streptomyces sp. NPDC001691 TaxID=3364600 RepID=UPI003684CF09
MSQGGGAAHFRPDRADRKVLLQDPAGPLGAWSGMAARAGWAALPVAVGRWAPWRRDA